MGTGTKAFSDDDPQQGHIELLSVLNNEENRIFYERFIRTNPQSLSCMHCWLSVR